MRESPDMMPCVMGNAGREEYIAARRSMRSVTTRDELRNTHVLPPNLHVNLVHISYCFMDECFQNWGVGRTSLHISVLVALPMALVGWQVSEMCFQKSALQAQSLAICILISR